MDQLRNDFLLYCFLITHAAMLLSQPSPSHAIILCDGDCVDNVDLDICRPFNDSKKPIYVMAFFPCNTGTFRARGFTVAAQMAIRAVQRSNSILQDYSLRLAFNNTKVNVHSRFKCDFLYLVFPFDMLHLFFDLISLYPP